MSVLSYFDKKCVIIVEFDYRRDLKKRVVMHQLSYLDLLIIIFVSRFFLIMVLSLKYF